MDCPPNIDVMELFIKYLEGNMVGIIGQDGLCGSECFVGPEVGETCPPTQALLYRGGIATIIDADVQKLQSYGLVPYPHNHLTTEHSLTITRALATLHAHTLIQKAHSKKLQNDKSETNEKRRNESTPTDSTIDPMLENNAGNETQSTSNTDVEAGCLKDRWTAQVSRLNIVQSNLSIMVSALQNSENNQRTVRRLEALQSDLPTLTQFLQFASAMQTCKIPSVGPVHITDVWILDQEEQEDEEVVAIRMRGGHELQAPPLRDAAWVWLTLLGGETLRERYMELCDDYCSTFNKTLLRQEATSDIEEMSYFDVMRDLGENFLHAFITIIHKFVVSSTWFFDRQLHTDEGLQALMEVISFLVDNGIVGSIFVI